MWRFYLDGNLQSSEDLRWENITFGLKRFEEFNALFFEYATGLEFTGDAYDYLSGVIAAGNCDQVHLLVHYKCDELTSQYSKVFEGSIFVAEAEEDLFNCVIRCEAEDNSFSQRLIALKDKEIPLDALFSEDGTSITPMSTTTVSVINPIAGAPVPRLGYKVFSVLQFMMRYITNNQSSVTSTFFSTAPVRAEKRINFTNTAQLTTGVGNIVITFITPFNTFLTVTSPIQASVVSTLNYLVYNIRNTSVGITQSYYENEWARPNYVVHNGTNNCTITWNMDFEITSITGATTTITDISDATPGGLDLTLFSGLNLRGQTVGGVPSISFSTIWDELNKIFNLGFILRNVGGVATMEVEQIEDIFNSSTENIEVMSVPEITRTRSFRFAKDTIKVGDGGKKQGFLSAINRPDTWYATTGSCKNVNTQDCKNDWVVDHDRIVFQRTTTLTTYDEDIFLHEVSGATSRVYFERAYTNTGGASVNMSAFNVQLSNFWKVKNWLFSSAGNMGNGTKALLNTTVPRITKEQKFKAPVPIDTFLTLKDDPENFFKFSPTSVPQDGNIGWVDEVEFSVKTSMTEFKLLTP